MDPPDPPIRLIWETDTDFEPETCELCGAEGHPFYIESFHRGCRLSEWFPNAYATKNGMLFFDPRKMREEFEKRGKKESEQD
jgi:hypothetical protein